MYGALGLLQTPGVALNRYSLRSSAGATFPVRKGVPCSLGKEDHKDTKESSQAG